MASRRFDSLRSYVSLFAVLVVTLTYHSQVTLAGLDRWCSPGMRPHRFGVCGRNLPPIMDMMCRMFHGDRSGLNKFFKRSIQRNSAGVGENMRSIMLNKKDAFSFLPSKRQGLETQSIVCECCYNRCSPLELVQYCDISSSTVRKRSSNAISSRDMVGALEDSYS